MAVIVVEVDGTAFRPVRNDEGEIETRRVPVNQNWLFPPLQRLLRGKFDMGRSIDPAARVKALDSPVVPGQRLALDVEKKTGTVIEPLRDPENANLVRRLLKYLGHDRKLADQDDPLRLGPREQVTELRDPRDIPTWLYWMKRGVESGTVRLVAGKLPDKDKIEGKPRKLFVTNEYTDAVLESQQRMEAMQYAMLTPEQRAAFDKRLADLRQQQQR